MKSRKIKVLEVSSELGAGTRGSSLGPSALRFSDINKGRKKLNRYDFDWVDDMNEVLRFKSKYEYALNIDTIAKVLPRIADKVENYLVDGNFPLVVSGDHSNAAGTISGIKNFIGPDKRLGVVWIDAHADLHSPYTTPSGNVHGMPLAALLAEDNLESQSNEPDEETIAHWESLKRIGSKEIVPKIEASDIVFIDIRDLERQEWDLIDELDIEFYTPKEIQQFGIETVAKETLDYLKHCDYLYISFDVDSLDPSVSTGTGTPYPDGLKLHEAKTLLYHLLKQSKTIAFEITEINPLLDENNKMARAVLEILEEVL
ncbi:MAG: arginase [Bacteroidetes bacterium]|nr:MAG: arginase [Bacteroidota bacterium]